MKKTKNRIFRVASVGVVIFISALASFTAAWIGSGLSRVFSLIAGCGITFFIIASIPAFRRVSRLLKGLGTLVQEAKNRESGTFNLSHLIGETSPLENFYSLEGLYTMLAFMNDDIAVLQRSSMKFDLFSSDILFSAKNMAVKAEKQLELISALRELALEYFDGLTRTTAELSGLSATIRENAKSAEDLQSQGYLSRKRLSELIEMTGTASAEARKGGEEVAATDIAASKLEEGLQALTRTAAREATEARKIGESLKAIEDIVERTHVLATNASIEAARAGVRGAGFAVIAQEVRTLAASSRTALAEIGAVLQSVGEGIDESSALVSEVSGSTEELSRSIAKSRTNFHSIDERVRDIEKSMEEFNTFFSTQIESCAKASASAEDAVAKIDGFEEDYKARSMDYEKIREAVRESEKSAEEAQRSARVLAQLADYLKAGGGERNRVLRKYIIDPLFCERKYGRKSRRETLLYNLKVFDSTEHPIGHLLDLSTTGLRLLCERSIPLNSVLDIRIDLPLSLQGSHIVDLKIRTRRVEADRDGFQIGCSLEGSTAQNIQRIEALLSEISIRDIDQGESEEVSELEAL